MLRKKRTILVILDGAADKGKNTPFDVSKTPNLDSIVKISNTGMMYPIKKGIAPESDLAFMALLGNKPEKVATGRGIIEAVGSDVKFRKNDLLLRANISKTRGNYISKIQGGKLTKSEIKKVNSIHPDIEFIPTLDYRAVLKVKDGSPFISNSHPGYKKVGLHLTSAKPIAGKKLKRLNIKALKKGAKPTADLLNSFSKKFENIIKNKTILLRGAANKKPQLKKLRNWAAIADTPVEFGVANLSGMKVFKPKKNMEQDARFVKSLLKKFSGVYIQIKDPDHFGHLGSKRGKIKSLEKIDRDFFSELRMLNFSKVKLIVTSDHATPHRLKAHSSDPVPFLITGDKKDKVLRLNEHDCKKGFYKTILGYELLRK